MYIYIQSLLTPLHFNSLDYLIILFLFRMYQKIALEYNSSFNRLKQVLNIGLSMKAPTR